MFTEIKKLIAKRSLTITVSGLDNDQIRVNVVPRARPEDKKVNEQLSYSNKNEVASVPEEAIKAAALAEGVRIFQRQQERQADQRAHSLHLLQQS